VGKGKEQGVFGQKAIFFLPGSHQNREGGRAGGRPAGVPAGGPVLVGDQRMGEKEEEAEGIRFPYLPWAVAARGDGSTPRAEGGGAGYGRQAPVLRQGRKVAVVVRCDGLGSGRPPL
jgi:hypothetical protein